MYTTNYTLKAKDPKQFGGLQFGSLQFPDYVFSIWMSTYLGIYNVGVYADTSIVSGFQNVESQAVGPPRCLGSFAFRV